MAKWPFGGRRIGRTSLEGMHDRSYFTTSRAPLKKLFTESIRIQPLVTMCQAFASENSPRQPELNLVGDPRCGGDYAESPRDPDLGKNRATGPVPTIIRT